ncbi:MAG: 2'-5' RNA ligase family protein [Bacteroidetes bacterium]|nr:2'-5' RNA ligase family protein [Bacteroidota bacterium]
MRKYFIAIIIPEPLFQEIENIKQELFSKHHLKGALRSPAHITLHRPFEWKEEKENVLIEKLKTFEFKKQFSLDINGFSFFEPRVIFANVLPNETLNELHTQLTNFAKRELKLFNEAEDLRGFHPHITVAFRDLKKPKFYELQKDFSERKLKGAFSYSGFSLLRLEEKWEEVLSFK